MNGSVRLPDGRLLEYEQELIEVSSSLPQPDEDWTYTDRAGHEHRYADGYPTLTWIIDESYWCEDCGDEHTEGHYECPLCGEHITPGLRGPDLLSKYQPGRRSYYLDGELITKEQVQAIAAEFNP